MTTSGSNGGAFGGGGDDPNRRLSKSMMGAGSVPYLGLIEYDSKTGELKIDNKTARFRWSVVHRTLSRHFIDLRPPE